MVILTVIALLLSIIVTVIGSFYFSIGAVTVTTPEGQPSAWGMEYLLSFFGPIPGLIGFAVAYIVLYRIPSVIRCVISTLCGITTAFLAIAIFGNILWAPVKKQREEVSLQAQHELIYFKNALEGKYQSDEIREHYRHNTLTDAGINKIHQALYEATQTSSKTSSITTIQPKVLPVMLEVFEGRPGIVGLFVALPEIPTDIKLKIAESKEPDAVKYLARDKKTPQDILLKLATHPSSEISRDVFYNLTAPQMARYIYSIRAPFSEDWRHRDEGRNPPGYNTVEEKSVWAALIKDNRDYVRTWVARSQIAPPQILADLADDNNEDILKWLILNNQSTQNTKNKAARTLKTTVPELIDELTKNNKADIRKAIAQSKDTPAEVLKILSDDREDDVRRSVAENPHVTPDLLERLGNESSHYVLVAVAKNPKTPTAVLNRLLNTGSSLYKVPEVAAESLRNRGYH